MLYWVLRTDSFFANSCMFLKFKCTVSAYLNSSPVGSVSVYSNVQKATLFSSKYQQIQTRWRWSGQKGFKQKFFPAIVVKWLVVHSHISPQLCEVMEKDTQCVWECRWRQMHRMLRMDLSSSISSVICLFLLSWQESIRYAAQTYVCKQSLISLISRLRR